MDKKNAPDLVRCNEIKQGCQNGHENYLDIFFLDYVRYGFLHKLMGHIVSYQTA